MEGSKSELWTELELFYAHIYVERRMSSVEIWALFILLSTKQFEGIFLIWKALQAGNKSVLKKLVSKQTLFFLPPFFILQVSRPTCCKHFMPRLHLFWSSICCGFKNFPRLTEALPAIQICIFPKGSKLSHAFNMQNPRQFCFHLAK